MKAWIWIPVGAGAALVGYGLLKGTAPPVKALKPLGGQPVATTIPKHVQGASSADASYCELLTAYRQDKRRWEGQRDDAKLRMQQALDEAKRVCDEFAWNASWKYVYAGLFGSMGSTQFKKTKSNALLTSCQEYVKGNVGDPGRPSIPAPPTRGAYWYDGTYTDVAQKIRALKAQVEDAKASLPGLREKYRKAKADFDEAKAKLADLEKRIRDLEAKGVYC